MSRKRVRGALREAVIERAQACCEYCAGMARYSMSLFSIDHIVPSSADGQNDLDNLALTCQGCNGAKYNKTTGVDPVTLEIVSLFNPRIHDWQEHFAWDGECTHILGITSIGRATVETLYLNRDELVNLRTVLYAIGEHPPPIYGSVK